MKLELVFLALALAAPGSASQETTKRDVDCIEREARLTSATGISGAALQDRIAVLGYPAPREALVFERREDGSWAFAQLLEPFDNRRGFGDSVSLSGNRLVLGAPRATYGGAYVYVREQGEWVLEALVQPEDNPLQGRFGQSVALVGDLLLVGAPEEPGADGEKRGAVYVFERDAAVGWIERERLVQAGQPYHFYGYTLDFDGRTAVIGDGQWSVEILVRGRDGWRLKETLVNPAISCGSSFGSSLSLDQDVLWVGDFSHPGQCSGASDGAVYEYRRTEDGWEGEQIFKGFEVGAFLSLGLQVGLEGEVAFARSQFFIHLFHRDGDRWRHWTTKDPYPALAWGGDIGPNAIDGRRILMGRDVTAVGTGSASTRTRTAGNNPPDALNVSPVAVGGDLTVRVRLGSQQPSSTIFAFDTPLELVLPGGQALLCHDGGGSGLLFTFAAIDDREIVYGIPPDPWIVGFSFIVQAFNDGGPDPFVLSNAVDVRIADCDCP